MELPPLVAGSWPRDLEIQLFDACAEHRPVGMYPYAGSTCLQDHLHRSCTILLPQLAVDSFFSHHTFSHFPPPPRYTLLAGVDRHFRMVSILRHLRQWHPDLTTVSSRCLKIAIQIYNQRRETTGKRGGKDTAYLYIYA